MYNVDEHAHLYTSIKLGGTCYEYDMNYMDRIVSYGISPCLTDPAKMTTAHQIKWNPFRTVFWRFYRTCT